MFYENLKKARKKAGLSQEKIAEIVNTSRSNISKYENGKLEPNLETLKKLCEEYDVSADEILEIKINKKNVNITNKNNISIKQRDNGIINIKNK